MMMRLHVLFQLVGVLLGASTTTLLAKEETRHVRVQVEYIEMPLVEMSKLLDNEEATKTDTILREHVQKMIEEERAKHIETQLLVSPSGSPAATHSVSEYVYPTEYEPAEAPTKVLLTPEGKVEDGKFEALVTGPTPTAFETRNLGTSLRIEPKISSNSKYIHLHLESDVTYFSKFQTYATWKSKRGDADIKMPEFYTMDCSVKLTLSNKKPMLVAAQTPQNEEGVADYSRKVLIFVRAHIIGASE